MRWLQMLLIPITFEDIALVPQNGVELFENPTKELKISETTSNLEDSKTAGSSVCEKV
jgi:hypothetical protein